MNLKVSNSVTTKTYALTNAAPAKPYLNVSNSFLPLTTNTTSGLKLKVTKNNNTYRALEYGTVSSSDTFYTSANVSDGLSSTTGLTRVSTSGTTYLTRASTSDTKYGTRASTSNTVYGTRASTSGTKYGTRASTSATSYLTRASTSGTTYLTRASTSGQQTITEYTSIASSTLESHYISIGYLGISNIIDYTVTSQFDSKGVTLQRKSLAQGVTFKASDLRNNNFNKITFGGVSADKGITACYMSGYTSSYRYNTYVSVVPLDASSTYYVWTWTRSGTQPTSYPNMLTSKYYPWDPIDYATLTTVFGTTTRSLRPHLNRRYYTESAGSSIIGRCRPLLSYTSEYTTSGTFNKNYNNCSSTGIRGIAMSELFYAEYLAPTTRVSYLTRASTSNTVYGTRASTSNTVYGTRASTSGTTYLTRASTSGTTYYTRASTSGTTYLTRASTSGTNYGTRASTSGYSGVSSSSNSTTSWI